MKRVLIIEDDKSIAEIERDYIESRGYEVVIKYNGREGMEEAVNNNYDLILLDLMLPVMDGIEVCWRLREKLDIPIVIVTAKKEDADKIVGLGAGADDYIVKPFSPSELCARVESHISRYERLTKKPSETLTDTGYDISSGNLIIKGKSRRVYIGNDEITLKNKEFDLLYFLATNPDVVFSKNQIFEKIWGMDSTGDNSTVTVHINRLREKIEVDPSKPQYIETVWGAGYRFKA